MMIDDGGAESGIDGWSGMRLASNLVDDCHGNDHASSSPYRSETG